MTHVRRIEYDWRKAIIEYRPWLQAGSRLMRKEQTTDVPTELPLNIVVAVRSK